MIIRTAAYARAGLIGNPSDGYFGKTIAFTFSNFFAEVLLGGNHAAVAACVRRRHGHRGPMAEYRHALALVREAVESGREPLLASWF